MHLENPTKIELAKSLGVSRASLYYEPTLPQKDWLLKIRIEQTLQDHPSYGHKRIGSGLRDRQEPRQESHEAVWY